MTGPDPYAARHGHFALAGRARSVWAIFAGLLAVEAAWLLTGMLLIPWPADQTGTAFRTFVLLAAFLAMAGGTVWVARRLQRRDPSTLIGPAGPAARDALRTIRALLLLFAVLYLVQGGWGLMSQSMPVLRWAVLLPVACLGVLIQTGAEELLYRGYLQQSLGARHDHPALWMVLPSVLFGASHYNPELPLDATLSHMIWTTAFGLAAADLTARTGSLGAAIGMHFAHNLPLVALVAAPGTLSGFALFLYPPALAGPPASVLGLGLQLFYLWMVWMTARIAIRL